MCNCHVFLGEFLDRFFLTSFSIIPQQMIDQIDHIAMSMVEHGFDKFYYSVAEAYMKRVTNEYEISFLLEEEDDQLQSIAIEQIWPVIYIVLSLNGIATIIFVAEILHYKWKNWRNC